MAPAFVPPTEVSRWRDDVSNEWLWLQEADGGNLRRREEYLRWSLGPEAEPDRPRVLRGWIQLAHSPMRGIARCGELVVVRLYLWRGVPAVIPRASRGQKNQRRVGSSKQVDINGLSAWPGLLMSKINNF